ncbi:MAG: hypothetical protein OER88_02730 [Planctomycetota bacterium]|nr:hypothetical protein [Planctomycetota bacterium]
MLLAAGIVLFLLAGVVYFRGAFRAAALIGGAFWAVMGAVTWRHASTGAAVATTILLIAAPAVFLAVHAYDARRGVFLMPTIYAIPLAFLSGALLVAVATIAWAF